MPLTQSNNINNINLRHIHCIITKFNDYITITNTQTKTGYINYHEARLIYTPAAYRCSNAAGLIDLLFKGHVICFYSYFAIQAGC